MRRSVVTVLIPLLLIPIGVGVAAPAKHAKVKHPMHAARVHPQPPKDTFHFPEAVSEARIFQIPDDASLPSGRSPPEAKQAEPTTADAGTTPAQLDCTKDPKDPRCHAATIQARPIGR